MAICDTCGKEIDRSAGHTVSGPQAASIMRAEYERQFKILGLPPSAVEEALEMARQAGDNLVCNECLAKIQAAADAAKGVESLSFSGLPVPSRTIIIGRGFAPSEQQVHRAIVFLMELHKEILTNDHFAGTRVNFEAGPSVDREAFLIKIPQDINRQYPTAYIADAICLDQKTGLDIYIAAIWEGSAAKVACQYLQKSSDSK